mmetsp:Transcript_5899/g.12416  ORF Transcript_5899/g.12416 Transcript_5899/m.12416 type:complete len:262 (-) Transcript_5899:134-919(-)
MSSSANIANDNEGTGAVCFPRLHPAQGTTKTPHQNTRPPQVDAASSCGNLPRAEYPSLSNFDPANIALCSSFPNTSFAFNRCCFSSCLSPLLELKSSSARRCRRRRGRRGNSRRHNFCGSRTAAYKPAFERLRSSCIDFLRNGLCRELPGKRCTFHGRQVHLHGIVAGQEEIRHGRLLRRPRRLQLLRGRVHRTRRLHDDRFSNVCRLRCVRPNMLWEQLLKLLQRRLNNLLIRTPDIILRRRQDQFQHAPIVVFVLTARV